MSELFYSMLSHSRAVSRLLILSSNYCGIVTIVDTSFVQFWLSLGKYNKEWHDHFILYTLPIQTTHSVLCLPFVQIVGVLSLKLTNLYSPAGRRQTWVWRVGSLGSAVASTGSGRIVPTMTRGHCFTRHRTAWDSRTTSPGVNGRHMQWAAASAVSKEQGFESFEVVSLQLW